MAKVYIITQEQMDRLNERLEMAHLRENHCRGADEVKLDRFERSDLYRIFNYEVRGWQSDVAKD